MHAMVDWTQVTLLRALLMTCLLLSTGVQCRTGTQKDGNWWCPWQVGWGSCMDGEFYCTCPGSKQQVKFSIGCCYRSAACGTVCEETHDCSRYQNCRTCKSDLGETSKNACESCEKGYRLLDGQCSKIK